MALCHGLFSRRHLPRGHEDRCAVVPRRAGCGAGLPDWRARPGLGQRARPAGTGRRPALAQHHAGRGSPGSSQRLTDPGAGRSAAGTHAREHLAMAGSEHAVARRQGAQLGRRLLRPHVGALHAVGAHAHDPGHAAGRRTTVVGGIHHSGQRRPWLRSRRACRAPLGQRPRGRLATGHQRPVLPRGTVADARCRRGVLCLAAAVGRHRGWRLAPVFGPDCSQRPAPSRG